MQKRSVRDTSVINFGGKINKRGISAIIAVVMVVLITVAAVTIIWAAIIPMIQRNIELNALEGNVVIVTRGGYTAYDAEKKVATVQVKRGPDSGEMNNIRIIFSFNGSTLSSLVPAPGSGQSKTYTFDLSEHGEPGKVEVAPIFSLGNRDTEGAVTSEVVVPRAKLANVDENIIVIGEDYVEHKIPVTGLVSWWNFDSDFNDSVGSNNGVSSGEILGEFEGNLSGFVLGCSSPNSSFVSGQDGQAVKIWTTSTPENPACLIANDLGAVSTNDTFWVWAKGQVRMLLFDGTTYSHVEDLDGNSYASYVGNVSDWKLFKVIADSNIANAKLYVYSGNGVGEANASYYDRIIRGPNVAEGALYLDGVDDHVSLTSSIVLGNGGWTVTSLVKTLTPGAVLSNSLSGPVTNVMSIEDGVIRYRNYDGTGWKVHSGEVAVNDDAWHLLTWVNYDDQTMDMYIDGVLDVGNFNSFTNNGGPVNSIGSSWDIKLKGQIDNVMIYNRTLSEGEITSIYELQKK